MKYSLIIIFCSFIFKSYSQEKDLNYFIDKAKNNSPLLKDLSYQMQSNAIDSLLYIATYKPQIAVNASVNYAPIVSGYGYDNAISNGQTVSGLVGVNKKILNGTVYKTQAENFKFIKQALQVTRKIAIKDLNKAIITQYIAASGTLEQIKYNEKIEKLVQNESLILKKLTQNSVYKQTDYLIFASTVKQQEFLVLQLQQQYQNDVSILNYLSGEIDDNLTTLKKPEISLQSIQKAEKNIFIKQFEIDSLKIQAQNKIIDAAYKPQFSLLADAGYLSSIAITPYKNFGFSVGAGLTIPLYDGGQRTLNHQKSTIALETNAAYKTNFKKKYKQQLIMLNKQLQQLDELNNQLQSQLKIVEALIQAHKKLLVTGDAQITEYVLALGNLITINNSISQNSILRLQLINEINYWNLNE